MVPLHPRCLPSSTPRGDAPSWGSPRAQLIAPTTPAGFQQAEKAAKPLEIRNPQAFPSAKPQPLQEAAPGDKKGLSTGEPRRKTARAPITGNTTSPTPGWAPPGPAAGGSCPPAPAGAARVKAGQHRASLLRRVARVHYLPPHYLIHFLYADGLFSHEHPRWQTWLV